MKRFWHAVGGGALGLAVFVAIFSILCLLGWELVVLAAMAFAILIGACTGLIYSKLSEMHDDLCTAFSQQEEIKAMVERLDKNVRELKRSRELEKEAADKKEPPADDE